MDDFAPLLAGKVDLKKLKYPCVISPKLDGIRAINLGAGLMSRKLKPIPNRHVQKLFGDPLFRYLDGELICGDPTDPECYNKTNSAVMSKDGEPDVSYYVFDFLEDMKAPFHQRFDTLADVMYDIGCENLVLLGHVVVQNEEELLHKESEWLELGYEGVMIRSREGIYKQGRSTTNEGILLKLKRFEDGEAEIIGFEELMHNENEATLDELGHTKRSSHQDGKVPANTLGALIVRDLESGVEFNIGTGFDAATRKMIWDNRETLKGKIVKYKSFRIGVKDKPRFPVFLGFRDPIDM